MTVIRIAVYIPVLRMLVAPSSYSGMPNHPASLLLIFQYLDYNFE